MFFPSSTLTIYEYTKEAARFAIVVFTGFFENAVFDVKKSVFQQEKNINSVYFWANFSLMHTYSRQLRSAALFDFDPRVQRESLSLLLKNVRPLLLHSKKRPPCIRGKGVFGYVEL